MQLDADDTDLLTIDNHLMPKTSGKTKTGVTIGQPPHSTSHPIPQCTAVSMLYMSSAEANGRQGVQRRGLAAECTIYAASRASAITT